MKPIPSASISFEQLQQLITLIYDAAIEPELWEKILEELVLLLKAEQSYMRIIDTESNNLLLAYCHNKDPEWVQAYKDYYIHQDPWLNDFLAGKDTFIAQTQKHMTNEAYEKLEFYNDFVRPQKTHYGLGGKISLGEQLTNYFAFNRDKSKGGFEDKHLNTLKLIVPHIQKSLLVTRNLQKSDFQHHLLTDALNQINNPLLLTNNNGEVLFINKSAEETIENHNLIQIKDSKIQLTTKQLNHRLETLIHKATHTRKPHGGSIQIKPGTHSSLTSILVSPVNPELTNIDMKTSNCALIVFNINNQQKTISLNLLTNLYSFTPAEARLAAELCDGKSLDEIAVIFSVSKNTLRTQLRACFNKTGTSRQTELISLINSGPASILKNF